MTTYRHARYWLLLALAVALLPHVSRLPWWLNALLAMAGLWRLPAVESRAPLPNKWLLALMLFGGIAGVRASYHTWFGPEAGVAFLIFCLAMKLLESRAERDHYVLMVLSLFVLATAFFFEQGVFASVYSVFAVLVAVAALVATNLGGNQAGFTLRKAGVMLAQAIPLMLILFVFFPRLPPLWSMKLTDSTGRTGMSDSMAPGDLARLGKSDALAFRVEFPNGQVPPKNTLYWRGLTFTRFDGVTWSPSTDHRLSIYGPVAWSRQPLPDWTTESIRIRDQKTMPFRVILEPTDKRWLFSLPVSQAKNANIGLTRDFMLTARDPVFQRLTYDAEQFTVVSLDANLPEWMRRENLLLPADGNPVTRKMAVDWRRHFGDERAYLDAVLRWFRKSPFHYTLEPPPLGANRIDDFLFRTRRGFCEHYASSFTFLMRAAGIPSRVVAGYQGGDYSPTGDSWQVRQMDAHAWVEVWLDGRGWVQFDPTAAVAPERIDDGMGVIAEQREVWGDSALSALRFSNYQLLGKLRNMADYVNYRWQRDVVGFDTGSQEEFLLKLLGDSSFWRRLAVMFGALVVVAGVLALFTILRHRKHWHPADRVVLRLSRRLVRKGLQRMDGEGVMAWMQRLELRQPHWKNHAALFARNYSAIRYQPDAGIGKQDLRELARLLRTWPEYRPQKTQLVEETIA